MFVIADSSDLTALLVSVEANNAEAGESDECGSGTFIEGHEFSPFFT
jgi:hypothetical protein